MTATARKALPILLSTHQPLDLVIIMLGTNDIKYANRCRAFDASMGMTRLIEIVQKFSFLPAYTTPQILIMSPPALVPTTDEWFNDLWGHAIEELKLFAKHYARVAKDMGVHFFDAGTRGQGRPDRRRPSRCRQHQGHRHGAGAGGEGDTGHLNRHARVKPGHAELRAASHGRA